MNSSDTHYTVTPNALTVYNITPDDANVYICNVTNQCDSNAIPYTLEVIGKFMHYCSGNAYQEKLSQSRQLCGYQ